MPHHRTAAAIISVSLALVALTACGSTKSIKPHQPPPASPPRPYRPERVDSDNQQPTNTTTTVLGPTGSLVHYPAAQPRPPSLAGAYPDGNTVNLITVLKTLATYRDWVYSHPNPSSSPTTCSQRQPVQQRNRDPGRTLQAMGWHEDPTPTEIL